MLTILALLFFVVVDALGVAEAGSALNFVVVIVVTTGAIVLPAIVKAGIVLGDTSTME